MSSCLGLFDFPAVDPEEAEKQARQSSMGESSSSIEGDPKRSRSPSHEQDVLLAASKKPREGVLDARKTGSSPPEIPGLVIQLGKSTQAVVPPYVPTSVSGSNRGDQSRGRQILDLGGAMVEKTSVEALVKQFEQSCQETQRLSSLLAAEFAKEKEASAELGVAKQEAIQARQEAAEWEAKYKTEKAKREKIERACKEFYTSLHLPESGV